MARKGEPRRTGKLDEEIGAVTAGMELYTISTHIPLRDALIEVYRWGVRVGRMEGIREAKAIVARVTTGRRRK